MTNSFLIKRIITFYVIAIMYTWSISLLIILDILPKWFHYVNALGPALATAAVLWKSKTAIDFKSFWIVKKPLWLLFGGLSPLLISTIIYLIMMISNVNVPNLSLLGEINFLGNISWFAILLWLFSFGIGEEIGWRGFLFPFLSKRYSTHKATLLVWIFWTLWHLPFFFYVPNYMDMNLGEIFGFIFSLLSGTVILSWLFEKSDRNLPTVILFHTCFNFITASAFGQGNIAMILSAFVISAAIIIFFSWIMKRKHSNTNQKYSQKVINQGVTNVKSSQSK